MTRAQVYVPRGRHPAIRRRLANSTHVFPMQTNSHIMALDRKAGSYHRPVSLICANGCVRPLQRRGQEHGERGLVAVPTRRRSTYVLIIAPNERSRYGGWYMSCDVIPGMVLVCVWHIDSSSQLLECKATKTYGIN